MASYAIWAGICIAGAATALIWALNIACWDTMPGTAECAYRLALHYPTW